MRIHLFALVVNGMHVSCILCVAVSEHVGKFLLCRNGRRVFICDRTDTFVKISRSEDAKMCSKVDLVRRCLLLVAVPKDRG